uniref:Histamine N-methyltransferase n=1 Tax=Oryzias sinensis TaxID=183150 RepID=A0A8C7XI08_9TELE
MDEEGNSTCYDITTVDHFQLYLEKSGEHSAILQSVQSVLPKNFRELLLDKSSVNVLGVGSGGGEMDVQLLSLMQTEIPAVPISADVVEGSSKLIDCFKALVAKTPEIQKIPFCWHAMSSEEYEKLVKTKGDVKKFDFIHMIQMIYYVESLEKTLKFYHSLLKNNGRLMIIVEAAHSGWDILWKTYRKELCGGSLSEYRSSSEVVTCLKSLGLNFEEHLVPNTFDITECFDSKSVAGDRLLSFMTATDRFRESFTPEIRAGILELLRNQCSTEKEGRVFFNSNLSCILVNA